MTNNRIDYIEFKANDLEKIKSFYASCFGWSFTDYGPDYTSFSDGQLNGGFERTSDKIMSGALVVLYHDDLDGIRLSISNSGGEISKEIFSFPGGMRFHFLDPSGNELAVWSDK